ncbi:MAG: (2Fe-2S)-binding protein [Acidobacteriota bacterium]
MSLRKDPEMEPKPRNGYSRRGFVQGVGLSGAVGVGLLESEAQAQPAGGAKPVGPGEVPITLQINGKPVKLAVEPRVTLLDALRNKLDMTGAKRACNRGMCGSCTVIMDGKVVDSCCVLAIDAQGRDIQTIEGLSTGPKLDPVIVAFVNNDALQCGFCTPGMVMATKGFLAKNPTPTYEQVEKGFGGNLCRCGTYVGIRKAVLEAAKAARGGKNA